MRIPLLVPCDGPSALDAALASGADAVVLDLGAAESPGDRGARRRAAASALERRRGRAPLLVVRVAALPSGLVDADLDAVMAGAPDAVLVPGVVGRRDVGHIAAKLAVREAEHGLDAGRTRIAATVADTARGVLALSTLPGASPRLLALSWDAGALARDLGVIGCDAAPCRFARSLFLTAAAAAGLPAIDAGSPGDAEALAADCGAARRDGFSGKLALHADQVPVIAGWFRRNGIARPGRGGS